MRCDPAEFSPLQAHRREDRLVLGVVAQALLLAQDGFQLEADLTVRIQQETDDVLFQGQVVPDRPEISRDAAKSRVRSDTIFGRIRRNHPGRVVIVERSEPTGPVESPVERGAASNQSLHDPYRGAREYDQQTAGSGDPPLPDRVQFRRDLGQPALVGGEVLELVEDDDQVPLRHELEQRAKDRAPGGVILEPEVVAGPAGGFFDERVQLRRLGLSIDQDVVRHSAAHWRTIAVVHKYICMRLCWYTIGSDGGRDTGAVAHRDSRAAAYALHALIRVINGPRVPSS